MNILLIIAIATLALVYLGFRWNNMRTKLAFFLILFGVLFLFFISFMISGRLDFADLTQTQSSLKGYFLSIKGFAVRIFETTGRIIGRVDGGNLTG